MRARQTKATAASRLVTIAAIQSTASSDPTANLAKTARMVRSAAKKGAQIICLQELYRTIYFPQRAHDERHAIAETIPGESTETFAKLAKELGVVIIVPVFEQAHRKNGRR